MGTSGKKKICLLLTYKENVHSTQMYIPLKPLFSRHNGIGVQFTDEPTGNLDYQTGQEIMKLICASRELYRQTIVMVTHDMDSANYADRIMYMEDGALR